MDTQDDVLMVSVTKRRRSWHATSDPDPSVLLGHVPAMAAARTSLATITAQLITIEHDELTDLQTGARLPGPSVWVPKFDEKLLTAR